MKTYAEQEHADVRETMPTAPWLTLNQAGRYANLSTATLRREAKAGRLRGYKVGGRRVWRLKAADVDAWLEGASNETVAQACRTVRR